MAPRLPSFKAAHPEITVNLTTRFSPFDFRTDTIDAAIHYGMGEWPGAQVAPLLAEMVLPVCAPSLKRELNPSTPDDLIDAPLLHMTTRPDAWERWFAAMKIDPGEVHGMLLVQFTLSLEAARAGPGVVLLPAFLIETELARGGLSKCWTRRWPA